MIITGKRRRSIKYLYPWQRNICIDNRQNSSNLRDYQIKIEITDTNTLNKMKDNAEDIRFYAGITKLSYWIEEKTSSKLVVWVKVPLIPGSSTTRIYMYFGNPSATSESNGEAVFEFFDDFEGTSLDTSKWNIISGSPTVSDGRLQLAKGDKIESVKTIDFSNSYIIETTLNYGWGGETSHSYLSFISLADSAKWLRLHQKDIVGTGEDQWLEDWTGDIGSRCHPNTNAPLYRKIIWNANTNQVSHYHESCGWLASNVSNSNIPQIGEAKIQYFHEYGTSTNFVSDYIKIRKYTDPEPLVMVES